MHEDTRRKARGMAVETVSFSSFLPTGRWKPTPDLSMTKRFGAAAGAAGITRHALAMTHSTKRMRGSRAKQKGTMCVCLWAFAVQMAALRNLTLSRQERRGDTLFFSSGLTHNFAGCSFGAVQTHRGAACCCGCRNKQNR